MRSLYIPAIIDGLANVNHRCMQEGNRFGLYQDKYDPSWYTDTCIFEHEHALTSYWISKRWPNFRETQRIRDNVTLWADSGGYTVATKGVNIDPINALKWQEKNSDVAFTLDIPPTIVTSGNQISPGKNERVTLDVFESHAERTRENNLIFYNNRNRHDLLIYNVQHGWDIKTFDIWWDYTAKETKFDGYATGIKPSGNALLQALSIMYLWNKGVRERIHLLGISGITVIPVLVWVSQYIDKISFDSTSYGYGSLTRAYVYPERIRDYTHFGKKYATKKHPMEKIYCNCPVCKDFEDPSYFIGNGSTWPGMLLSLHNLWCVKQYVEELDKSINEEKNINKFNSLVKQHTAPVSAQKIFHAINFIEDCFKYGFKKSYDLYFLNTDFAKPSYKKNKII